MLWLSALFRAYYYRSITDSAYLKAALVEIIDIIVKDAVFSLSVDYQVEPRP